MKLVIGLGNPGAEYINTRHNVGHLVVDELQKTANSKQSLASQGPGKRQTINGLKIFKSSNFMNESGSFVKSLYTKYHIQNTDLYVIHDDLDIKLGEYKIQLGHSPKDHNGIKSIDDELGTNEYWHVKVGIDNRPLDNRPMGIEYVLQNFSNEERMVLDRVVKEVASKLDNI